VELWEAGILIVGGIWLVGHMAQRNAPVTGSATTVDSSGLSNQSNLTNITNQAGGTPTVYGEPLEPAQAPLLPAQNVYRVPLQLPPVARAPVAAPIARPIDVHSMRAL